MTFSGIFNRDLYKEELRKFNKSFLDGLNKKGELSGRSRRSSPTSRKNVPIISANNSIEDHLNEINENELIHAKPKKKIKNMRKIMETGTL